MDNIEFDPTNLIVIAACIAIFAVQLLLCLLALLGWWVCGGCVISEPVRELMERMKQQIMRK